MKSSGSDDINSDIDLTTSTVLDKLNKENKNKNPSLNAVLNAGIH